jgi:hypothetical protein
MMLVALLASVVFALAASVLYRRIRRSIRQPPPPFNPSAKHIIVLCPGFLGRVHHMFYLARSIAIGIQHQDISIYIAKCNSGPVRSLLYSSDGIDSAGRRLAEEIQALLEECPNCEFISFFGFNIGGLVARYCIGLLFDDSTGFIVGKKPSYFVSFGTAHAGLASSVTLLERLASMIARTPRQIMLLDSSRSGPLLLRMADSDSIFFKALAAFSERITIANMRGERYGVFSSDALSLFDPPTIADAEKLSTTQVNRDKFPHIQSCVVGPFGLSTSAIGKRVFQDETVEKDIIM